jgi:hypothetical protein
MSVAISTHLQLCYFDSMCLPQLRLCSVRCVQQAAVNREFTSNLGRVALADADAFESIQHFSPLLRIAKTEP